MKPKATIVDVKLVLGPVKYQCWDEEIPGGAECVFTGITRPESHPTHGSLVALHYEAHESMALTEMQKMVEEAVDKWSPLAIRLHHSTGKVPTGRCSVLIQVTCLHRKEAFEACRWLIDDLKRRIAIWKQELWQDGETWVEGTPLEENQGSQP